MRITRLHIRNFRAIRNVVLEPSPSVNGIWGNNGQGKTSILEAIAVVLKGKSFRPYCNIKDVLPRKSSPNLGLNNVQDPSTEHSTWIELHLEDQRGYQNVLQLGYADTKWHLHFNGKKTPFGHLVGRFPAVVFSPDDHQLIRGSPDERRDFINELYSDVCPGYWEIFQRYQKTLKQRNQALKSLREQGRAISYVDLEPWNTLVIQSGVELAQLRQDLWPELQSRFLAVANTLSDQFQDQLQMTWQSCFEPQQASSMTGEFRSLLERNIEVDRALGWTRHGPHRDDFCVSLSGLEAKTKASQGQARLLALALKWTYSLWVKHSQTENPIFLIDDLSSELDSTRREGLLSRIKELEGQVFISGTDPSVLPKNEFKKDFHYEVENGEISFYNKQLAHV